MFKPRKTFHLLPVKIASPLNVNTVEQLLLLLIACIWIAQYSFGHQNSGGQSSTLYVGVSRFRADAQTVCHLVTNRVTYYCVIGIFRFGLKTT